MKLQNTKPGETPDQTIIRENSLGLCCHIVAGECKVLNEGKCDTCNFRQTLEQLFESKEKAAARLRTLPEDEQKYIAGKYYHGKMPWREAENAE